LAGWSFKEKNEAFFEKAGKNKSGKNFVVALIELFQFVSKKKASIEFHFISLINIYCKYLTSAGSSPHLFY
jgi:hypothetical protein